jgi:hypothetical protein
LIFDRRYWNAALAAETFLFSADARAVLDAHFRERAPFDNSEM